MTDRLRNQALSLYCFRKESSYRKRDAKEEHSPCNSGYGQGKCKVACYPKPEHHKDRNDGMKEHGYVETRACSSRNDAPPDRWQERISLANIPSYSERIILDRADERRIC